jgi:phage gp29-like protein
VGKCPPDAVDSELIDSSGNEILNANGDPTVLTPEEAMLRRLLAFKNASAIAIPNGAEVDVIEASGGGEAFTNAIDLHDRQMVMGVLIAIRSTMEAEHGSKADSSTAQDILTSYTQMIQRSLEVAFYRDVIYPTVVMNFGEEAADTLCPYLSLSDVAREDVVAVGNMIANLARANMIHSSQYPGIDAKLNLPERDFEAQMEEQAEERDQAQMLKGMLTEPGTPGAGKSGGTADEE